MRDTQAVRPPLSRAAFRLAGWQIVLTLVIAAAAGWLGGTGSARSALLGGGIGTIAGLYQALRMFRSSAADDPARFLRAVYVGEAMKVLLTAAFFVAAIRVLHPQFLPMMAAYTATFFVYWAALGSGYPWLKNDGLSNDGPDDERPAGAAQAGRPDQRRGD